MAGEIFKPRRIITRGTIKELVRPGLDGSADEQSEEQALTGSFTRTLAADPPGAFIFECHCGHKRRVTYEEKNFRCERGGIGAMDCDILWTRKQKESEEIDENGKNIMVDDTVDETIEVVDDVSGKKRKMRVPRPVFVGRKVGELKAEEFARRKARGEPVYVVTSNEVVQTTVLTEKQQRQLREAQEKEKNK